MIISFAFLFSQTVFGKSCELHFQLFIGLRKKKGLNDSLILFKYFAKVAETVFGKMTLNPGPGKFYTTLQTVCHRFNIYVS